MRILIISIIAVTFFVPAKAQTGKVYTVNSIHQDGAELIKSFYKYSQFQNGKVVFTSQPMATAPLNYNYLSGQLLFISTQGDTLEFAKPETLQYVAIGADTFYYVEKGFAEKLTHYPAVNLSGKKFMQFNGKEKKGAYGTYSGTGASTSVNTVYSNGVTTEGITVDENTLYATSRKYYISDKFYNFFRATKKDFYSLFSNKEQALTDYLANNTVHYNNENDLRRLLEYLQGN